MIKLYENYLFELNKKLDKYFSESKMFIKCKKGCSLCCKFCYYPYTELEYTYLRMGIKTLSKEQQKIIKKNALKILNDRNEFIKTNDIMKFTYDCPVLINDTCGLYQYRGLLCRTFGLAYHDIENDKKINIPHCVNLGLSYADLYDKITNTISAKNIKDSELKSKIKIYDLSYSALIRDAGSEIHFGDVRMLFEWIIMDIPNYEEILKKAKLCG